MSEPIIVLLIWLAVFLIIGIFTAIDKHINKKKRFFARNHSLTKRTSGMYSRTSSGAYVSKYYSLTKNHPTIEKGIEDIKVKDMLYFVHTLPGASTGLRDAVLFYLDNKDNLCRTMRISSDSLRKLVEKHPKEFVYLAGGLGCGAYINRKAIFIAGGLGTPHPDKDTSYICSEADLNADDYTCRLVNIKFRGKKYWMRGYIPFSEFPKTGGEEIPMTTYDWKAFHG